MKNLLFLKKKKQKDFFLLGSACGTARSETKGKSFLVLFFKKEPLLFLPWHPLRHHPAIGTLSAAAK